MRYLGVANHFSTINHTDTHKKHIIVNQYIHCFTQSNINKYNLITIL